MAKFIEKRKRKYEEMNKKRKYYLGMQNTRTENEQARECLMCREKFNHQTDMVYMAKLSMNESFTSSYHGSEEK